MFVDTTPPGAWESRPLSNSDLQVRCVSAEAIQQSWSGHAATGWAGMIDGAPFIVERGIDGDHRFVHGAPPSLSGAPSSQTRSIHHLGPDASVLLLAPTDPSTQSWWRVVLDSVLFTVALLQGYEALHAGALATPAGAIAITASTGGGKSSLLAELLDRGHRLMADDVLVLDPPDTPPALAHPAPPLMTVPATRIPQLIKNQQSQTISRVGAERWIGVPVCPDPLPVKALVVLDRGGRSADPRFRPALTRIENPLAPLLEALMRFPRTPERERARFELASTLASEAGVWRLTAGLDTPVSLLADALLAGEL